MKYKIDEEDYLQLWIYFEDRATSVKGAMFNTITWIIGFAAALLGFIFSSLSSFDILEASIELPTLMKCSSLAGMALCGYAFLALNESAKHIRNNWIYADHCLKEIEGLGSIVSLNEIEIMRKDNPEKPKLLTIWNQLRILVILFMGSFVVLFFWSFYICE